MKPLMLHGHERAITQIKYNLEGDLLFSCAKDTEPNVWYSINGERLGSYKGHSGALWCIDVDWETNHVLTGAADNSCRLWDCETGKQLEQVDTNTAVRSCGFSYSANQIMYTTDKTMGHTCEIYIYDHRDMGKGSKPVAVIPVPGSKVTSALWGPLEKVIVTGHDNGEISLYDMNTHEKINSTKEHSGPIMDIQFSHDMTMFVSACKDTSSKLFDTATLEHLKTFKTDRPVNSAALSPIREHAVTGGGQEAMSVTTTDSRSGKFDAKFFHMVFEEQIASVKGHFGPINSLAFSPDGLGYSSGGEDGYVRIHKFDPNYFNFDLKWE